MSVPDSEIPSGDEVAISQERLSQLREPSGADDALDVFESATPEEQAQERSRDVRALRTIRFIALSSALWAAAMFGSLAISQDWAFWLRALIATAATALLVYVLPRTIKRARTQRLEAPPVVRSSTAQADPPSQIALEAEGYLAAARQNIGQLLYPLSMMTMLTIGTYFTFTRDELVLESIVIGLCVCLLVYPAYARIRNLRDQDVRWGYLLTIVAGLVLLGLFFPQTMLDGAIWAGRATWEALSFVFVSTERVMLVAWCIGLVYNIVRTIEWYYGLIYVTPSKMILRRGVIFVSYPSMERKHISDSTPKRGLLERLFRCWKLVLESTGQKQSLNTVNWVPSRLLPYLGFSEKGDPQIKLQPKEGI